MNIFENYLDKIKNILVELSKKGELILPEKLNGITTEIPPSKFNSDISTNVAMVLSKINKISPMDLAKTLSDQIKKSDKLIEEINEHCELGSNVHQETLDKMVYLDAVVNEMLRYCGPVSMQSREIKSSIKFNQVRIS